VLGKFLLVVTAAAFVPACASSLASMQPATVVPHLHVQAVAALDLSLPEGSVQQIVNQANDISRRAQRGGAPLSDADRNRLVESALSLFLSAPSIGPDLQLGIGLFDRLELDARYALGSWRGGLRLQLLGSPGNSGFAATIGAGVSRFVFDFQLPDPIQQVVSIDDFTRYEVDVPLLLGWSSNFAHLWFGPKLIWSSLDAGIGVCTDFNTMQNCTHRAQAQLSANAFFAGAQVGLALGYRLLWVAAELTVAQMWSRADGRIADGPTLASQRFEPLNTIIYPSVGLLLRL
jgi:hypothetical protein